MLATHLTARAVAVLASGLLALGLAQAPSTAADTPGGLGADRLRELAATLDLGSEGDEGSRSAASPRRVDVVTDRRGDAERPEPAAARAPRPYTRLADLTRVRYKTPAADGGALRITTRWADLVDGSRKGVRRQTQLTFIESESGRPDVFWVVEVTNADNRVRVYELDENSDRRIRPESYSVARNFGAGGTTDVVLSSEWLDAAKVSFGTISYSGGLEAYDSTRSSRTLKVGPVAR